MNVPKDATSSKNAMTCAKKVAFPNANAYIEGLLLE